MCGRFVSATPPDELARYFGAEPPSEELLEPDFNVAPTASVFTVVERDGSRLIEPRRWGLVPIWAKEEKVGNRMFNARSETVATKGAFKSAFAKRRCIIPADGFYEWTVVPPEPGEEPPSKPKKQPVYVSRADGDVFAFAGLGERWFGADRERSEPLLSCTILTGSPNEKMAAYHDRMPVILPPDAWDRWLDRSFDDLDALQELFVPVPSSLLTIHPVSTEVNNSRTQGRHLIEAIAPTT